MPAKHIITSRKSSPVKNEVSYRSSQRATVAEYKSPYDQARDYVKHFTCWNKPGEIPSIGSDEIDSYEKPFSVQMPFDDWVKLSNDLQLSETEQRYPKYGYNASISTLIIKCMPSPVHESAIDIINSGFIVAREGLPPESDFGISTGEEFLGFEGQYAGSLKVPDLAVEFTDAALGSRPKFIVEVGLSETYDDLLQDAKLWLEGTDYVSIVVLVKFVETPKYESLNLRTKDLVDRNFLKAPDLNELHFEMRGEYGPVQYKGIQWAGVISEAFLEVWKRNPITRLAVRDGGRTNLLVPADQIHLSFRLSNFTPIDSENDRPISFNWGRFQGSLKRKIKILALKRCQRKLEDMQKRSGEIGDPDYQP